MFVSQTLTALELAWGVTGGEQRKIVSGSPDGSAENPYQGWGESDASEAADVSYRAPALMQDVDWNLPGGVCADRGRSR